MQRALMVSIVLGIITASISFAQDSKIKNQTELSYVDTGGNTEVTTLSAKNILTYKVSDKLIPEWEIGTLYAENDNEKSVEKYYTEIRFKYLFSDRLYSTLRGGWLKDKFAGIDPRYYAGPVAGYNILLGPKHFFNAEVGLDYVKEEYIDDTDNDYLRGRLFAKYEFAFTKKNRFSQSIEYLHDFEESDNYNINSETALISALSDSLSLKASYKVEYDNMPVPTTLDDTDTTLTLTLVINF